MDVNLQLFTSMENLPGTKAPRLNLGEWNMVYVSFLSLHKGQGYSKIVINGASDSAAITRITTARDYSRCTAMSNIRFGNGFVGELKRIQVYSPAALIENSCNQRFFFINNLPKILVIRLPVKLILGLPIRQLVFKLFVIHQALILLLALVKVSRNFFFKIF